MPRGKGTYGSQVGRPKNSTDNYAQTKTGKGSNSTDNMNDGAIDRNLSSFLSNRTEEAILRKLKKSGAKMPSEHKNKPNKPKSKFTKLYEAKMGRKTKDGKMVRDY